MRCSRRRFWLALGGAAFCTLAGFGVRYAEDLQVGYTHDTSLWIFGAAVLFAYYAAILLFLLKRRGRRTRPKSSSASA
ncbi:MAG: hypothetical protein ACI4RA_02630 [Kiritimatiellia bacterium]